MLADVITFISQEVADLAAAWFAKYDIEVASVEYYNRGQFSRSLMWRRNNVQRVIDTDPERLLHYGQLGYQSTFNGEF
jgi:precorrin-6B methylase 2